MRQSLWWSIFKGFGVPPPRELLHSTHVNNAVVQMISNGREILDEERAVNMD